jgi:glycogen phosphorylase
MSPRARDKSARTGREPLRVLEGTRPAAIRPFLSRTRIAYFTMELALRTEMHTYCGGLGLLAGDTVRSSADLGIPMVFVTMLSRTGYFRQEIDPKGRQVELPDRWDPNAWCKRLAPVVTVGIEGRSVGVQPWLATVTGTDGFQNPILLLDTDLAQNSKADRTLSDSLYGGNAAYRLKQEIVLGIGGVRVLRALGFQPLAYHMNEGHASFLTLELLQDPAMPPQGISPRELRDRLPDVRARCVFTTHSPVEAAHDRFDYALVRRILRPSLGLPSLRKLGGNDRFDMTRLGLNLSHYVNGVSLQHAKTARTMFRGYRIHAVTNGVHVPTWVHPVFAALFDSQIPRWRGEPERLVRALQLEDGQIWDCHLAAKRSLLARIRERAGVALDPEALTLVFARRMVSYKRPLLLFEDPGRLADLASGNRFQVVFTGKAHPLDRVGKRLIHTLHERIRQLEGTVPCVFLPNYDMDWAKALVAGADVWFQNPLPPMEASGTSGMKAALNGGLNLSTLDGWWEEGCIEGVNGWSFSHTEGDDADRADAAALYRRLEDAVLPCYYDDTKRWRSMMKQAIGLVGSYFTSQRMLRQYAVEAYLSSAFPGTTRRTAS